MSPFPRWTKPQKFNTVKFSDLYNYQAEIKKMPRKIKDRAKNLLKKQPTIAAKQIQRIIDKDKPVSAKEMEPIIGGLKKNFSIFGKQSPKTVVKKYFGHKRAAQSGISRLKEDYLNRIAGGETNKKPPTAIKSTPLPTGGKKISLPF